MLHSIEKGTPSVFVVTSPFQALCAIAAIRQFEIEDYKFIVAIHAASLDRKGQLLNILFFFQLKYELIYLDRIDFHKYRIKSFLLRKNRYKNVFIGDLRFPIMLYIGLAYSTYNANVICLDDGNATIAFLKTNENKLYKSVLDKCVLKSLSFIRGVDFPKIFCTVYCGLSSSRYKISNLKLSFLTSQILTQPYDDVVYFIGTNNTSFCAELGFQECWYYAKLSEILKMISTKHKASKIYYIAHGRDDGNITKQICEKKQITFVRPNSTIELFALEHTPPKYVYGFTSSALYNLKQMYPSSEVINILFDALNTDANNEYRIISDYYLQNGIHMVNEKLVEQ